ncbi:MAG: hypothetical protein A2268_10500 [Candidatus Raymondbacteria bacterium RifOxyA12_full_50_37]|nr:MAG: hypothetical protein A2268_10500 [Candidatus Raymondbacteria bacterium RifOxyA12_full_50_37]OGJ85394.1 MAG: hypothetical protein A2248_12285 [Candidatus Raymondbacteria bacterium RIFOXYA2_FULL_49_16]OGJ94902.1 MAG: hypothetical protein A2453_07755 [Candidatus Raymondbacteria bacterium RIFOXYC2_FULL_50_21]OGP45534.1 MAG: hypothetical protein A2324_04145 [Candidatus Raymondbacteria bacterium RIFOXYB2_FULL_49_35]
MNKILTISFIALFSVLGFTQTTDTIPQIWVQRLVTPDSIFYEGAPSGSHSTVNLRAWASNDSITQGLPLDVILLTDNSGSMGTRNPGTRDWIPPVSRIQGAYNACVNFVDSTLNIHDSVAHMRFCAKVDTPQPYTNNFALAKAKMDTNINGKQTVGGIVYEGTASYTGILEAVRYMGKNAKPGRLNVLIALTDGEDNASGSYGWYWTLNRDRGYILPNLGTTKTRAVDSVVKIIDSLTASGINFKIFTINLMTYSDTTYLKRIARQGHGTWSYSNSGADLDAIFYEIGQSISDIAAVSLMPGTPMIIDVLGPDIHYVPGSFVATTGMGYQVPTFQVDTVSGFTRLKFLIDTVRVGKFIDLKYEITAALYTPDVATAKQMRTNNASGNNPTYYSLVQYVDANDSIVTRPVPRNYVYVKSEIGGVYLSTTGAGVPVTPMPSTIAQTYTFATPATYPNTLLYAIRTDIATDTIANVLVPATWYFYPNPTWTATTLNGVITNNRTVGVTVAYDNHDTASLRIRYMFNNQTYGDTVLFSFTDISAPEQVISTQIERDTASHTQITSRFVVRGDTAYLRTFSYTVFARGLTNRSSNMPISATWSKSGFANFGLPTITGVATQKTFSLTDIAHVNFTQNDSGTIRIDYNGYTSQFQLVIYDTTDYDTTDRVVLYNNTYSFNKTTIETNYPVYTSNDVYTVNAGDSITFWPMFFDNNRSINKYLSTGTVSWTLNGSFAANRAYFGIRGFTPGSQDLIIASYTNEWGVLLRDTVRVGWNNEPHRYMSIESQPGVPYSNVTNFVTDTLVILNTQTDTVGGLYAVVRDGLGYCVSDCNNDYESWTDAGPGASYITVPGVITSTGWIYKTSNPAAATTAMVIAIGQASYGLGNQRDTVFVRIAAYSYDKLDICAAAPIQGFSIGDTIPRNTVISLAACELTGSFQARARHDATLWDIVTVSWTVKNGTALSNTFPLSAPSITLDPVAGTARDTLFATYAGATTLRDTMLFSAAPAYFIGIQLDSTKTITSNLQEITVRGNLTQLRNTMFWLYAMGNYNCTAAPRSPAAATWNTTLSQTWFSSMINQTNVCSVFVNFNNMPNTQGSHSASGQISISYTTTLGNVTDNILFNIIDTTDYDTLEYLIVDTSASAIVTFSEFMGKNIPLLQYSAPAGSTIPLYATLYDLNNAAVGLFPKRIGADQAIWQIRHSATGQSEQVNATTYNLTSTGAGTKDTIVVSYPAPTATFTQPIKPTGRMTQTIIVSWTAGTGRFLRIVDAPTTGASDITSISMQAGTDTVHVYAIVVDQFNNRIANGPVQWSSSNATYITVPTSTTYDGKIVKASQPSAPITVSVVATLPANTNLGNNYYSGSVALYDTVTITIGNFTFDSLRIVTYNNPYDFTTTENKTISGDGAIVSFFDLLLMRTCAQSATFKAQIHSTNPAMGVNGWVSDQVVTWVNKTDTSRNAVSYTVSPVTQVNLDTIRAISGLLHADIHFKTTAPNIVSVQLLPHPANGRIVVSGDSASIRDTSITFTVTGTDECGNSAGVNAAWNSLGFTRIVWANSFATQLGLTAQSTKIINFLDMPSDTTPQSDSGYIAITYTDPVSNITYTDSIKLIIRDNTDYDTVDKVVIVPDSMYRTANNKDDLYAQYSNVNYTQFSGDSIRFSALLFDINANPKFLANYEVGYNNAHAFWYLNGKPWDNPATTVDSVFVYGRTVPGADTIVVLYGNTPATAIIRDTVIITWTAGHQRVLYIESAPGTAGSNTPQLASTMVFTTVDNGRSDTVYAVIRDEFNNFVTNDPLERWTYASGEDDYFVFLRYPTGQVTNLGVVTKLDSNPPATRSYHLIANIVAGTPVKGVTLSKTIADTIAIDLANYSFVELGIFAASNNIISTTGVAYPVGARIPQTTVLTMTSFEDTIRVETKKRRNDLPASDANAWLTQSVSWRLSVPGVVSSALFPATVASRATLAAIGAVTLDTLVGTSTGDGLSARILFTIEEAWIDSFIIIYNPAAVIAGSGFPFTIIALDKNGDTITDPSRLPTGFNLSSLNLIVHYNNLDTTVLHGGTTFISDPFTNGVSNNTVVTYSAGANQVIIEIPYPYNGGIAIFIDTFNITTRPGEPDSLVVINYGDSTPVTIDTLSSFNDDNSTRTFIVRLFDEWGNLITDKTVYAGVDWSTQGDGISFDKIQAAADLMQYNASDDTGMGGMGTINAFYVQNDGDSLKYSFTIVVIPLVRILDISTHEWVGDTTTALGTAEIESVIVNVLRRDLDYLKLLITEDSLEYLYVKKLREFGYNDKRDGYLDYLDITLSRPFTLKEKYVSAIKFKAEVDGLQDSVIWKTEDSITISETETIARKIRLQALDMPGSVEHTKYRLWLLPNSVNTKGASPLETGLLPIVAFNNDAVYEDGNLAGTRFPMLIGSGAPLYATPDSLITDSAPPVIWNFKLQNHTCDLDNPENTATIFFSEPVQTSSIPSIASSVIAFALVNGDSTDSLFMRTLIKNGYRTTVNDVDHSIVSWDYRGETVKTFAYQVVIDTSANRFFKANLTKIRFSINPSAGQVLDMWGNKAMASNNLAVTLVNDAAYNAKICNLTGNTVVDRMTAMSLSWTSVKGDDGRYVDVPAFPFFGFTVNLDLITNSGNMNNVVGQFTLGNRTYIICDFDTLEAFVQTDVSIYDLFGNTVATPKTNKLLHGDFTIQDIRIGTGIDSIQPKLPTMSLQEIERYYRIYPSDNRGDPDTLRPIYPETFTLGYEFLKETSGPRTITSFRLPVWNCLNAKGRLVAPGGYIAVQSIRIAKELTEAVKKFIVTSGEKRGTRTFDNLPVP